MPTCHSFETTCLLDRTTRRSIHAKNIFEVSGRGSQEDRSPTMPHQLKFECTAHSVISARCGHGHWTQAPLGSGANLIVEEDASKKRKKKKKESKGQTFYAFDLARPRRQLASFPLCETLFQIPQALTR